MAKKPPKATTPPSAPGGRALRTNTEMAEWLFRNFEWPQRLARYEAVAQAILAQHHDDPAHPLYNAATGILALVTAAKAARQRRQPIDVLMVTIEHKVRAAEKMVLLPLAERAVSFDPSRRKQPGPDRLDQLLDEIVRPAAAMQWKDVLSALGHRADPVEPWAVIVRVEDKRLWWRSRVGGRPRPIGFARLRNRLTAIKDHLAD